MTTEIIKGDISNQYIQPPFYVHKKGIQGKVEGAISCYRLIIPKEVFIEAYNKWIKEDNHL